MRAMTATLMGDYVEGLDMVIPVGPGTMVHGLTNRHLIRRTSVGGITMLWFGTKME